MKFQRPTLPHFCRTNLKTGRFEIRKTIGKRMTAKLKEIAATLQQRRHESIADTLKWLQSVVRGYYQCHAVPGNWHSFGKTCSGFGIAHCDAEVIVHGGPGTAFASCWSIRYRKSASYTLIPMRALPPSIQGKNRVR